MKIQFAVITTNGTFVSEVDEYADQSLVNLAGDFSQGLNEGLNTLVLSTPNGSIGFNSAHVIAVQIIPVED